MVEVARTHANFDIKFCCGRHYSRMNQNEESEGLRRPAHQGGIMGFELDRT